MTSSLYDLPAEILTKVFSHLEGRELSTCQLVCRSFNKLISSLLEFQFCIALQAAGYVEPHNPRTDIGIGEKLSILKKHLLCWNEHSPSSVGEFDLDGTYNGQGLTNGDVEPLFSDGVLAHWSARSYDAFLPLKLNLVQLPSPNKGLTLKEWNVIERIIAVHDYWLEPKYDLLILQSVGGSTPGTRSYEFHLRTLSTNEPHPDATRTGVLRLETSSQHTNAHALQVVGRLIFVHVIDMSRMGHIYCWDWTTGGLQSDQPTGFGAAQNLLFLSESVLVVPRSTFIYESENMPIALLDVYALDLTPTAGLEMELVATLEFPVFRSVPRKTPNRARNVNLPLIKLRCYANPVRQLSSFQMPPSRSLPSVFEPADSNRVLLIHFDFTTATAVDDTLSFVFVPIWSIWSAIDSTERRSNSTEVHPRRVPWEAWGASTRWVHRCNLTESFFDEDPGQYLTSGTRVIFPHLVAECDCQHNPYQSEYSLSLDILDFHPSSVRAAQNATHARELQVPPHWIHHSGRDSFTPTTSAIDHWMTTAELAVAPYAKSVFKHALFRDLGYEDYLKVWMDEEHLLFLKRNEIRIASGIDVFTF